MAGKRQFEFFLLRYVPNAVQDEFVNVGVVLMEPGGEFADVKFTHDWRRVRCLDPQADVEMLEALEREIRGQLREMRGRDLLLKKLQDSFSNVIQISPTKACLAEEPEREMRTLVRLYFEGTRTARGARTSARQLIVKTMREAFEQAGVGRFMKEFPVAPFTRAGDPLKFDFGFRVGDRIRLFHAVSLKTSVDQAITLAARYPQIAVSMERKIGAHPQLTGVVEDAFDRGRDEVQFALSAMEEAQIEVTVAGKMPEVAEKMRRELGA